MLLSLIIFVVGIALFTVGVRWGVVAIGKLLGRTVSERHHNAEYIISTGAVPEDWMAPYFQKIDAIGANHELSAADRERRSAEIEAQGKRESLRRLDDLLKYFRRAPVFEDDTARQLLLGQLRSAKEVWEAYAR
jgi:hypothetical protein